MLCSSTHHLVHSFFYSLLFVYLPFIKISWRMSTMLKSLHRFRISKIGLLYSFVVIHRATSLWYSDVLCIKIIRQEHPSFRNQQYFHFGITIDTDPSKRLHEALIHGYAWKPIDNVYPRIFFRWFLIHRDIAPNHIWKLESWSLIRYLNR